MAKTGNMAIVGKPAGDNFDPDAYLQKYASAPASGGSSDRFDPDAYLAQFGGASAGEDGRGSEAFLEHFGRSLSLGLLPYAQAGLETAGEKVLSKINNDYPDSTFKEKVKDYDRRAKELHDAHPYASVAGEVAGFAVPGMGAAKAVKFAKGAMGLKLAADASRAARLAGAAGTLAAEGGLIGAAYTPEGGNPINVSDRLKSGATGAALGGAGALLPKPVMGALAGYGLGTMTGQEDDAETGAIIGGALGSVPSAIKGVQKLAPKLLAALGGVKEETIKTFAKDPERFLKAKPRDEVLNVVGKAIDHLDDNVAQGKTSLSDAKAAVKSLETTIKEGQGEKAWAVRDRLKDAKQRLDQTYLAFQQSLKSRPAPTNMQPEIEDSLRALKQKVKTGSSEAFDILDDLDAPKGMVPNADVGSVYKNLSENLVSLSENADDASARAVPKLKKYAELLFKNGLSDEEGTFRLPYKKIKDVIRQIDSDVNQWTKGEGTFDDRYTLSLKNLRGQLDDVLKSNSPEYKAKMGEVAQSAGLLSDAADRFGKTDRGIGRLQNIGSPRAQVDRELLGKLGQATGKDFLGPVQEYQQTQNTLKSRLKMDALKQSLPEYKALQDAVREDALIKRNQRPQVVKEKVLGSRQYQDQMQAERVLEQAQEQRQMIRGWSRQNMESKVNSIVRGQKVAREQLQSLGNMSDADFVNMIDEMKVNEAFTKEATNGSRNVNFWAIIGTAAAAGGMTAGPVGAAAGAVLGAMADKYGPQATKQLLIGVSKFKGLPTVQKINSLNIPEPMKKELSRTFYKSVVLGKSVAHTAAELQKASDNQGPPEKGPEKWADDGWVKLEEHTGGGLDKEMLLNNPKAQALLIAASDLKPGSKAMDKVAAQLNDLMKKGGG